MAAEVNADFLDAFGLTQEDVDRANNDSGDNTDANPDAQDNGTQTNVEGDNHTEGQGTGASNTDTQAQSAENQNSAQNNDSNNDAQNFNDARNQRANVAFAQMRSENTALKRLVSDIAGVLGVDPNTPQVQMQAAVQDAIIKAQAKQQNVDPAVLQKISQLEQYKEQQERQSLSNRALMGFQTVKNQFNLSETDLDSFAEQLMQAGVNPFTKEVDLVAEYKLRNFDALIAAAEERGIAKEAARKQTVAAHSSQPSTTTGASSDSEPDKIKSVSELTKWFDNNTK